MTYLFEVTSALRNGRDYLAALSVMRGTLIKNVGYSENTQKAVEHLKAACHHLEAHLKRLL